MTKDSAVETGRWHETPGHSAIRAYCCCTDGRHAHRFYLRDIKTLNALEAALKQAQDERDHTAQELLDAVFSKSEAEATVADLQQRLTKLTNALDAVTTNTVLDDAKEIARNALKS